MADDTDVKTGVMVCLYPPIEVANKHALPNGLPPEEMHVTLAYLGKVDAVDEAEALKAVQRVATTKPFTASISGHARFTGSDEGDVLVALVDSPVIEKLRRDLIDALRLHGIQQASEHGYTPHMTLAYMDAQALAPVTRLEPEEMSFSSLWLVYGMSATEVPLGHVTGEMVRSYARTAYAQGWAASGGPMTAEVRAGCEAVMALAVEHWDRPDILEVAIHLGQLEGVWAKVFARREKLMADKTEAIRKIWQELTAFVDVPTMIAELRRELGVEEAATPEWLKKAKAAALALAQRILSWLPGTTQWQSLRDAMRDLIAASQAEGYADAIGVAASEQDIIGLDFEIAFDHAYEAIINLGETWAQADSWLSRMLGDAANEFGRVLGNMLAEGADYEELVSVAEEILGDTVADKSIIEFIVDWASSYGMSQGALNLYRSEGVQEVTWMTAGDGRVCAICEMNGAGSPYAINDFPQMPAHPRCRCVATAEFTITPDYGGYFV